MSSVKTPNNKFNFINSRVKYGTDGGINVRSGTLFVDPSNNRVGINTLTPTTNLDISGSIKMASISDYSNSSGNNTQILTNVNGQNLWSYSGYNFKGSDMFPVNEFSTSEISGSYIFDSRCGTLSPNGFIYLGSGGTNTITKINPYTNTYSTINVLSGQFGNWGACCAENGKIYMLGSTTPNLVLVIDTLNNDRISYITLTGYNGDRFRGMVYFNQFVYLIPYNVSDILRINTSDDTFIVDISGINSTNYSIGTNSFIFSSGVVGTDGKIYMIPINSSRVLRFDPVTKIVETSPTNLTTSTKFRGGVLASNNKIYCMPAQTNYIGIIDISSFAVNTTSITTYIDGSGSNVAIPSTGYGKMWGGILAPSGRVYGIPYNFRFLEIDTSNNIARQIFPLTNIDSTIRTYGGVLAPNGKIYCSPETPATSIPIIKTGIPSLPQWMMSPEFNKSL